jgi:hypothetical protein
VVAHARGTGAGAPFGYRDQPRPGQFEAVEQHQPMVAEVPGRVMNEARGMMTRWTRM